MKSEHTCKPSQPIEKDVETQQQNPALNQYATDYQNFQQTQTPAHNFGYFGGYQHEPTGQGHSPFYRRGLTTGDKKGKGKQIDLNEEPDSDSD
uniref:Uncharacterized protein n=1 Tax=Meloidogyne javanica TaxID=6303 RepID=A0A915N8Q3_MELJA